MQEIYESKTKGAAMGHVLEEMCEAGHAIGKIMRFGFDSVDPTKKPGEQHYGETNEQWLLRELDDLDYAIGAFRAFAENKVIELNKEPTANG